MDARQQELLAEVVRNYIRQAEPVGSKALEGAFNLSSATIRNEMAVLENEGYLHQPHTSAGRVPTAKAFQFYVDNLISAREPKPSEQRVLEALVRKLQDDRQAMLKSMARSLAEFAGEAVVIGFTPYDVYYTGFSNLFQQPEFTTFDMVQTIGRVVDHLDESVAALFRSNSKDLIEVCLGRDNPFGEDCAVVFGRYNMGSRTSLMGFLGPLRMDYDANIGRLKYVSTIITS